MTATISAAATDTLRDMLFRNETGILREFGNRDVVHELQVAGLLNWHDNGDGSGRDSWFSLTPAGETMRNSLAPLGSRGLAGIRGAYYLRSASISAMRAAAQHCERRIEQGVPGSRAWRAALDRINEAMRHYF